LIQEVDGEGVQQDEDGETMSLLGRIHGAAEIQKGEQRLRSSRKRMRRKVSEPVS
jgi:hypothetical protein